MQQRGECPPLLVVFDSCEGYFLELMALSSLLSGNLSVYNSKFAILRPKFDICMHTTGIFCVWHCPRRSSVTHKFQWHTHKFCEQSSGLYWVHTHFSFHFSVDRNNTCIAICSFTVQADADIKDMTFITEYAGDVDYLENRASDDCDCIMTLLLTEDPSQRLVICPDKRGNISRFISGINNYTP